jgi:hypothetical protein
MFTVQLLAAIVCGGLGGAVFTWLTNRRFRLPPVLRLELFREEGEKEKNLQPDNALEDVRYYHVRVSNERRWSPATDVQVFLTRIEEPGPGGLFQVKWVGNIPMRWRNQQAAQLTCTIGHDTDCDLCCVGKSGWLSLMPLFTPFSLEALARRTTPCHLLVFLEARSTQTDASAFIIQIEWDGHWADDDAGIKEHLKFRDQSRKWNAR